MKKTAPRAHKRLDASGSGFIAGVLWIFLTLAIPSIGAAYAKAGYEEAVIASFSRADAGALTNEYSGLPKLDKKLKGKLPITDRKSVV